MVKKWVFSAALNRLREGHDLSHTKHIELIVTEIQNPNAKRSSTFNGLPDIVYT